MKPVAWRLTGRSRAAGLVLMYHRVAEVDNDPWALAVSPRHFDEHLQVLRASYQTATPRQVAAATDGEEVALGTVVVTFDDGYADNLHLAKPLL